MLPKYITIASLMKMMLLTSKTSGINTDKRINNENWS